MHCQTHGYIFGKWTEEGMIGFMDLRNNLRYLIDMEYIIKNGDREAFESMAALLTIKIDEIDFKSPITILPTAMGPDFELHPMIACDKCGDKILSEEEKLISHNLFRGHLSYLMGNDDDDKVEGIIPEKKFNFK